MSAQVSAETARQVRWSRSGGVCAGYTCMQARGAVTVQSSMRQWQETAHAYGVLAAAGAALAWDVGQSTMKLGLHTYRYILHTDMYRYLLNGESCKRLAPPRSTKDRKHIQPKRPASGTTHRPSTRHHRNRSPRVKSRNTNQHRNRARLQHSNPQPSLQTLSRVIAGTWRPP